ncbi:MAG TPA: hypothetical protein VN903_35040 [Polyangia bacterium]|nr:hypothetical protein [Polyangia bacterium]
MSAMLDYLRPAWCRHRFVREHIDGVWYFVCDCGYRVPILKGNKE